jgi:hypothetical protein
MQINTFLIENSLTSQDKAEFVRTGVLLNSASDDENFMRLRGHYSQAAMTNIVVRDYEAIFPEARCSDKVLLKPSTIVSDFAVMDATGVDRQALLRSLSKVKAMPIPDFVLQSSNIFSGWRKHTFYTHDHMLAALNSLRDANRSSTFATTDDPEYAKRAAKYKHGLSLKHPEDFIGLRRCKDLYLSECAKIIKTCREVLNFPIMEETKSQSTVIAQPTLTYATLDYSLLDFRELYRHESFRLMQDIQNAADTKHLVDFILSSGTLDDLRNYAKAAKAADNPVVLSAAEKKAEKAAYVVHMNKARDFCKATWDKSRFGLDFEDAVDADKFTEAMCVAEYDAHLASGNPDPVIAPKKSEMTEAETHADREKWRKDNPSPGMSAKLKQEKKAITPVATVKQGRNLFETARNTLGFIESDTEYNYPNAPEIYNLADLLPPATDDKYIDNLTHLATQMAAWDDHVQYPHIYLKPIDLAKIAGVDNSAIFRPNTNDDRSGYEVIESFAATSATSRYSLFADNMEIDQEIFFVTDAPQVGEVVLGATNITLALKKLIYQLQR